MGRFDAAVEVCDEVIRLSRYVSDHPFIRRGVANWLAGREDEAIASWKGGSNPQYTDAAGGVTVPALLLFASIRRSDADLGRSSRSALKKLCRRRRLAIWPGPIVHFLLEDLTEEDLLCAAAEPAITILAQRYLCQAEFYVAVRRLAHGDQNGFVRYLEQSCSHGLPSIVESEFYLARGELERSRAHAQT